MLAFEPFDHGPIFGRAVGAATIGGVIAAGVSGSRRLSAGAVRDHVLGFEAVSGRAERFIAGGRVVKNVTGYDLPKLLAGSWGQLAVLTQVTLKVLPRPRESATVVMYGLDDDRAIRAMSLAMRSQAEVAAAAFVPESCAPAPVSNAASMTPRAQNAFVTQGSIAAMRLEGFGPSVAARVAMLRAILAEFGDSNVLGAEDANAFWNSVREAAPLNDGRPLWRISVAATHGPFVTAALRDHGARWFYDWAGGLIWLTMPIEADATLVRAATEKAGGHVMLVRADTALRATVPALHPEPAAVAALAQRIKGAFDPASVLDPNRFTTFRNAD
jgi:glycolate oxidase FAD binding subunit